MANKIYCIGISADRTFSYTVQKFFEYGSIPEVIDLCELSRNSSLDIDYENGILKINNNDKTINIQHDEPVFCRLIDVSSKAPNKDLRIRYVSIFYSLSKYFRYYPGPILNPPLVDLSNASKFFHLYSISSLCEIHDVQYPSTFIGNCSIGINEFHKEYPELILKGLLLKKLLQRK